MKFNKRVKAALLAGLLSLITLVLFQNSTTVSSGGGLKYFGFFADGLVGVGTGNYIEKTSQVANIHFVNGGTLAEL